PAPTAQSFPHAPCRCDPHQERQTGSCSPHFRRAPNRVLNARFSPSKVRFKDTSFGTSGPKLCPFGIDVSFARAIQRRDRAVQSEGGRAEGPMTRRDAQLDVMTIGRASVGLYGQQIGSRLEDIGTFTMAVGGCPANIAVGTARLGLKSAL